MNLQNSNDCEIKTIKRELTNVIVKITLNVTVRALVEAIVSETVTLMDMIHAHALVKDQLHALYNGHSHAHGIVTSGAFGCLLTNRSDSLQGYQKITS